MIRYSVGFQLRPFDEEPFSDIVSAYREHISEVFFSLLDAPSGRGVISTDDTSKQRFYDELKRIKSFGIKLDLLFNSNCYGAFSLSKQLSNMVCTSIEHLDKIGCGVEIVTTASPFIAHIIKMYFPNIEVRSSVNMKIGTVKGMEYLADLFDSFHVQREYNRNLVRLHQLREWANSNGKRLILLGNSGCFAHCSGQIFHDNTVAHQSEICLQTNVDDFNPYVCWRQLSDPNNWVKLLQNTWIRPEDIHYYDGIVDTIKLATRIHHLPGLVIDAYARRRLIGNTLDLFEPTFSGALAPFIMDNTAFPKNWFKKTTSCDKLCYRCNYCKDVLEKVLVNTGNFE